MYILVSIIPNPTPCLMCSQIIGELGQPLAPYPLPTLALLNTLASDDYLLPYYPVTVVIASKIEVILKNVNNTAATDIYKSALSSSALTIGMGPFTISNSLDMAYTGTHRFSIEGMVDPHTGTITNDGNNRLRIRLGGGQVVGLRYQLFDAVRPDEFTTGPTNHMSHNATAM